MGMGVMCRALFVPTSGVAPRGFRVNVARDPDAVRSLRNEETQNRWGTPPSVPTRAGRESEGGYSISIGTGK